MYCFLRLRLFNKICSVYVALAFTLGSVLSPITVHAQGLPSTVLNLPVPGSMLPPTGQGFTPTLMQGLTIHPDNPLKFDFYISYGDDNLQGEEFKNEGERLIKYFLASLTVPEDELWVNLSPYEEGRIISESFGETEMGRDLLAQDYLLKQLSASLMYPEEELGEKFWNRVYEKAQRLYGTVNIPLNTFNKIWIVPESAQVFVHERSVFVTNSYLNVMLEEDYLAMSKGSVVQGQKAEHAEEVNTLTTEIIREVLIPEIEKEVNQGKTFANLRQIFNSMILAVWYKQNLREGFLGKIYMDQSKVSGIDVEDKAIKEKIYQQYLEAFKQGVYDYIKEDYDPLTQELIPRKFFSGGAVAPKVVAEDGDASAVPQKRIAQFTTSLVTDREISQVEKMSLDANFDRDERLDDVSRRWVHDLRRAIAPIANARNFFWVMKTIWDKVLEGQLNEEALLVTLEFLKDYRADIYMQTNGYDLESSEYRVLENKRSEISVLHSRIELQIVKDKNIDEVLRLSKEVEELSEELSDIESIMEERSLKSEEVERKAAIPSEISRLEKRIKTLLKELAEIRYQFIELHYSPHRAVTPVPRLVPEPVQEQVDLVEVNGELIDRKEVDRIYQQIEIVTDDSDKLASMVALDMLILLAKYPSVDLNKVFSNKNLITKGLKRLKKSGLLVDEKDGPIQLARNVEHVVLESVIGFKFLDGQVADLEFRHPYDPKRRAKLEDYDRIEQIVHDEMTRAVEIDERKIFISGPGDELSSGAVVVYKGGEVFLRNGNEVHETANARINIKSGLVFEKVQTIAQRLGVKVVYHREGRPLSNWFSSPKRKSDYDYEVTTIGVRYKGLQFFRNFSSSELQKLKAQVQEQMDLLNKEWDIRKYIQRNGHINLSDQQVLDRLGLPDEDVSLVVKNRRHIEQGVLRLEIDGQPIPDADLNIDQIKEQKENINKIRQGIFPAVSITDFRRGLGTFTVDTYAGQQKAMHLLTVRANQGSREGQFHGGSDFEMLKRLLKTYLGERIDLKAYYQATSEDKGDGYDTTVKIGLGIKNVRNAQWSEQFFNPENKNGMLAVAQDIRHILYRRRKTLHYHREILENYGVTKPDPRTINMIDDYLSKPEHEAYVRRYLSKDIPLDQAAYTLAMIIDKLDRLGPDFDFPSHKRKSRNLGLAPINLKSLDEGRVASLVMQVNNFYPNKIFDYQESIKSLKSKREEVQLQQRIRRESAEKEITTIQGSIQKLRGEKQLEFQFNGAIERLEAELASLQAELDTLDSELERILKNIDKQIGDAEYQILLLKGEDLETKTINLETVSVFPYSLETIRAVRDDLSVIKLNKTPQWTWPQVRKEGTKHYLMFWNNESFVPGEDGSNFAGRFVYSSEDDLEIQKAYRLQQLFLAFLKKYDHALSNRVSSAVQHSSIPRFSPENKNDRLISVGFIVDDYKGFKELLQLQDIADKWSKALYEIAYRMSKHTTDYFYYAATHVDKVLEWQAAGYDFDVVIDADFGLSVEQGEPFNSEINLVTRWLFSEAYEQDSNGDVADRLQNPQNAAMQQAQVIHDQVTQMIPARHVYLEAGGQVTEEVLADEALVRINRALHKAWMLQRKNIDYTFLYYPAHQSEIDQSTDERIQVTKVDDRFTWTEGAKEHSAVFISNKRLYKRDMILYKIKRNGTTEVKFSKRKQKIIGNEDLGVTQIVTKNEKGKIVEVRLLQGNKLPDLRTKNSDTELGGIDLNPKLWDLSIKRDANLVPLSLEQQPKDLQINGLMPIIIKITPVPSVSFLLGLSDSTNDDSDDFAFGEAREPELFS